MLFGTGVISDKQFIKHLGKNIFIWPFNPANLKGSTYNLTASKIAYYIENNENISVLDEDNVIHIPAHTTVLIQTEESIYVTKNICGTYHTKVKMVSKGLSSISTTLDPCYFGTSLISITNLTNIDVKIKSGETFCSLMLYKMRSASYEKHDNLPFRSDISTNIINRFKYIEKHHCDSCCKFDECEHKIRYSDEDIKKLKKEFLEWFNMDFRKNRCSLIRKVKEYKKNEYSKKYINFSFQLITGLLLSTLLFLFFRFIPKLTGNSTTLFNISYDTIYAYFIVPLYLGLFSIVYKFIKI